MLNFLSKKIADFVPGFMIYVFPVLGTEMVYDFAEKFYNDGNKIKGRPPLPWELDITGDIPDID